MPKISIVDRSAQDYQAWLQPESPDHLTPRALSSELVLVHEWAPGHHGLENRIRHFHAQFTSVGAGWTAFQQACPAPATGYVRYIFAASCVGSNFAGAKSMCMGFSTGAPGFGNLAVHSQINGTAVYSTRPVILPVGWDLWASWYAAAAGEIGELDAMYADFRCCEPLPRL